MRLVRLMILAAFAIVAFGVVSTAVVSAEEPAILCLETGCMKELEGIYSTHEPESGLTLETLGGLKLRATDASIDLKNCEATGTEEKDGSLCKDQQIVVTGVEEPAKKVTCQTSGAVKGEVKALLDLHLAAEETAAEELQPLLLAKVLGGAAGTELVSPLEFKCSLLTFKIRGTLGCLMLPGLTNIIAGERIEILCKLSSSHDPETGKCVVLCEWLNNEPLEATNAKGVFEDAWKLLHLEGSASKDIFIDD